jgi:Protein of unknown function (DUF4026) C-terminal
VAKNIQKMDMEDYLKMYFKPKRIQASLPAELFLSLIVFAALLSGCSGINSMNTKISSIKLIIPLSEKFSLDASAFNKSFYSRWGEKISIKKDNAEQSFKISCKGQTFSVKINNQPLQSSMVDIITLPAYGLTEAEITQTKNNQASINIDPSSTKDAKRMVLCAGELLLLFLDDTRTLGFTDYAAQSYIPRGRLVNSYLSKKTLDLNDLYLLFVSVQEVYDANGVWMHSHGLEQFGYPNLEISFSKMDELSYYKMVIDSTAIYMLENGNILKPGDSMDLGDGNVFKISFREDQDSPNGIITLQRK